MSETTSTTTGTKDEKRDAALRESYGAATKRLREAHLAEFNALRAEEALKRGYEWTPQPTKEEKARAEILRLAQEAGLDLAALAGEDAEDSTEA